MYQSLPLELIIMITSHLPLIDKLNLVQVFGKAILNCRKICLNKQCDNEQLQQNQFCYNCVNFPDQIHQINPIQLYEVLDCTKYYYVDNGILINQPEKIKSTFFYQKFFIDDDIYVFIEHL
jgi:hypothetical protein